MESASGPNSLHLRGIVWFPFWWHGWKWICVEPRQGYAGYAIPPSFSLSLSLLSLSLSLSSLSLSLSLSPLSLSLLAHAQSCNHNKHFKFKLSYGIKLTAFVLRFPPRVLYAAGPVPPRQILRNTTQVWFWVDQVGHFAGFMGPALSCQRSFQEIAEFSLPAAPRKYKRNTHHDKFDTHFNEWCRNAALRNVLVATNICWTARSFGLREATVTPQITQCGYLGVKTGRNGSSSASGLANWSRGPCGTLTASSRARCWWKWPRPSLRTARGIGSRHATCRPQTATSGTRWLLGMVPGLLKAAGITAVMEARLTAVSSRKGKASISRSSGRSPRRRPMWKFLLGRLGASATKWCRRSWRVVELKQNLVEQLRNYPGVIRVSRKKQMRRSLSRVESLIWKRSFKRQGMQSRSLKSAWQREPRRMTRKGPGNQQSVRGSRGARRKEEASQEITIPWASSSQVLILKETEEEAEFISFVLKEAIQPRRSLVWRRRKWQWSWRQERSPGSRALWRWRSRWLQGGLWLGVGVFSGHPCRSKGREPDASGSVMFSTRRRGLGAWHRGCCWRCAGKALRGLWGRTQSAAGRPSLLHHRDDAQVGDLRPSASCAHSAWRWAFWPVKSQLKRQTWSPNAWRRWRSPPWTLTGAQPNFWSFSIQKEQDFWRGTGSSSSPGNFWTTSNGRGTTNGEAPRKAKPREIEKKEGTRARA